MIVAVALGLLIGLTLGALGGGGSILAVPVLVHLAGQSVGAATTTSLVAVGVASAVSSVGHARAGRVRWGPAAAFVATGVAGSWAGTWLNHRVDGDVLLLGFSVLVLVAAHRMLTACPSCTNVGEEQAVTTPRVAGDHVRGSGPGAGASGPGRRRIPVAVDERPVTDPAGPEPTGAARTSGGRSDWYRTGSRVLAAGTVVGFLTGLFGVGGGFVIVPALTLALGLSLPAAIGTSLVVIVGNAAVSLAFRGLDQVDWAVAVPFTATMLAGGLVGSLVAPHLPVRRALQSFAGLLVAVAIANGAAAGVALTA